MAVNFPPYYTSQILNADGKPVAGGTIRAYFTGTESPAPLFASDGTPLGSSVSIDAAGNAVFCLRVGTTYRLRCIDADGAVVWTRDGVRALGETAGMENPMTDYGDLIVGGVAGEPVRLSMGTAGQMLTPSTLGQPHLEWVDIPVQTGDHKVMADTMDQAPGALTQKLKAGSNVTLTLDTSGGTRKVEISAATQEGDHKASTDGTDTPGYLEDKVVAGTGVSVTKTSGQLVVSATGADTNEVKAGAADNAPGVLNDKIGSISSPNGYIRKQLHTNVDGSQTLLLGIDATSATDGQVLTAHEIDGVCDPQWQTIPTQPGDHHVLVTNADASAGTLADKLVAGSNVTLTPVTDGDGVQTLEIAATGGGGGGSAGAAVWAVSPGIATTPQGAAGDSWKTTLHKIFIPKLTPSHVAFVLSYDSAHFTLTARVGIYTASRSLCYYGEANFASAPDYLGLNSSIGEFYSIPVSAVGTAPKTEFKNEFVILAISFPSYGSYRPSFLSYNAANSSVRRMNAPITSSMTTLPNPDGEILTRTAAVGIL